MQPEKKNPALGARGFPNIDLLGSGISSEDSRSVRSLQVASLTRRCAISAVMAAVVAPLVFGEGCR